MSYIDNGPLASYNSLVDTHLTGFFANTRLRRHLRLSGLITKDGEIVSENMYRLNMSRKEHKKHVKDMLAQAIVHKTLDLERARQAEIRKTMEQIAKLQLVRRVRESRTRKRDEDVLPYLNSGLRLQSSLSPHPPKGLKQSRNRAVSAPARKGKRPLSGLSSNYEDGDEFVIYLDDEGRPISPAHMEASGSKYSSKESIDTRRRAPREQIDTRNFASLDTVALRKYVALMAKMEQGRGGFPSPYLIPQVPLPPKSPRGSHYPRRSGRSRSSKMVPKSSSPKRPSTALHPGESAKIYQGQQETMCEVSMHYHGSSLSLAREQFDRRQDILVEQQHCGGNTLTVFKDKLEPNTNFSFVSHRHRGYPFSLTIYIDGQMDCRVSTCCEYRHKQGGRIGGKTGHFSIQKITGAVPCYKCQVEKGIKVGYQAPRPKLKRPPQNQEEVTVQHMEEHKPRPVKKRNQAKGPDPKNQILVPVDNIEDHNGNDKYEDDFEASGKSSSSSSSSESDQEEYTNRKEKRFDDRVRKLRATLPHATRQTEQVVVIDKCDAKKNWTIQDKRGHRSYSAQETSEDYSSDNYYCSNTSYCSSTSYFSDTSYCNDAFDCSPNSESEHFYDHKKMILLKIIEEEEERRRIKDNFAEDRNNKVDFLDTSNKDSRIDKSEKILRQKLVLKKFASRNTITGSSNCSDSSKRQGTPSVTHDTFTADVSETGGTEDEVSDIESEIASSRKYSSVCNLSIANFDYVSADSNSSQKDCENNNSGVWIDVTESKLPLGYSLYHGHSDSVTTMEDVGQTENKPSKYTIKMVDSGKVEHLSADSLFKNGRTNIFEKSRQAGSHPVFPKIGMTLDNENSQGEKFPLNHHAVASAHPGNDECFEVKVFNQFGDIDCVGQNMSLSTKRAKMKKCCIFENSGRAQRESSVDKQREKAGFQDNESSRFRTLKRYANDFNDETSSARARTCVLEKLKEELKVGESQNITIAVDELVNKSAGRHYKKSTKKSCEQPTLSGDITTIPMLKTGENKYLMKQAREDARRRRESTVKNKTMAADSGKRFERCFKDLSPPEKVIRGFAGDSASESNNDEIYAELLIHGKQASVSDHNSENGEAKYLTLIQGKNGKIACHSTVELDETSVMTEEASQCEILIVSRKEIREHEKLQENVKETGERLGNNILKSVAVNNILKQPVKYSVSAEGEDCCSEDKGIHSGFKKSLILNFKPVKNEYNHKNTSYNQGNDTQNESLHYGHSDSVFSRLNHLSNHTFIHEITPKQNIDAKSSSQTQCHILEKKSVCTFSEKYREDFSVQRGPPYEKMIQLNSDTKCNGIFPKQKDAHLSITTDSADGSDENAKYTFFTNDDQNIEQFDSRAEIVGTRYVVNESDRYVKHHRAFKELPVLPDKHFLNVGTIVSILRPQKPEEAAPGKEVEIPILSVDRLSKSYKGKDLVHHKARISIENVSGKDDQDKGNVRKINVDSWHNQNHSEDGHIHQNYVTNLYGNGRFTSEVVSSVTGFGHSKTLLYDMDSRNSSLKSKENLHGSEIYCHDNTSDLCKDVKYLSDSSKYTRLSQCDVGNMTETSDWCEDHGFYAYASLDNNDEECLQSMAGVQSKTVYQDHIFHDMDSEIESYKKMESFIPVDGTILCPTSTDVKDIMDICHQVVTENVSECDMKENQFIVELPKIDVGSARFLKNYSKQEVTDEYSESKQIKENVDLKDVKMNYGNIDELSTLECKNFKCVLSGNSSAEPQLNVETMHGTHEPVKYNHSSIDPTDEKMEDKNNQIESHCIDDSSSVTFTCSDSHSFDRPLKENKISSKKKEHIGTDLAVGIFQTPVSSKDTDDDLEKLYLLNVGKGCLPEVIVTNTDVGSVGLGFHIENDARVKDNEVSYQHEESVGTSVRLQSQIIYAVKKPQMHIETTNKFARAKEGSEFFALVGSYYNETELDNLRPYMEIDDTNEEVVYDNICGEPLEDKSFLVTCEKMMSSEPGFSGHRKENLFHFCSSKENLSLIEPSEYNPLQVEPSEGKSAQIELGEGNSSQVELGEGNSSQVEIGEGNSSQVELGEGNSSQVELGEGNSSQVEIGEGNSSQVELGEGNSSQVELGEGNSSQVELGEGNSSQVELGEGNSLQVELGEGNSSHVELGEGNSLQVQLGKRKSSQELGEGNSLHIELGEEILSQIELGEGNLRQVEPREGNSSQVEPREGNLLQVKPREGNSSLFEHSERNSSQVEPMEINSSQVEPRGGNSSQVEPSEGNSSQVESREVNFLLVEPREGNSSQVEPMEGNLLQVEPREGNSSQVEPSEGNSSQVEPREGNSSQVEPREITSSQTEHREENSSQVEPREGNTSAVEHREETLLQVEPRKGNSSQVESREGNLLQVEPREENSSQVEPSEGNSSQVEPSEGNSSQVEPREGNSSQVEPREINSSQTEHREENSSQVEPRKGNTSAVEHREETLLQVEPRKGNSSQVESREGNLLQVEPREENSSQVEPREGNSSHVEPREENLLHVEHREGHLLQIEPREGNFSQVEPREGYLLQGEPREGNSSHTKPRGGNSLEVEPREGNSSQIEPREGNSSQVQPGEENSLHDANIK